MSFRSFAARVRATSEWQKSHASKPLGEQTRILSRAYKSAVARTYRGTFTQMNADLIDEVLIHLKASDAKQATITLNRYVAAMTSSTMTFSDLVATVGNVTTSVPDLFKRSPQFQAICSIVGLTFVAKRRLSPAKFDVWISGAVRGVRRFADKINPGMGKLFASGFLTTSGVALAALGGLSLLGLVKVLLQQARDPSPGTGIVGAFLSLGFVASATSGYLLTGSGGKAIRHALDRAKLIDVYRVLYDLNKRAPKALPPFVTDVIPYPELRKAVASPG